MTIDDVDCPFCWDTGYVYVMEPSLDTGDGVERKRRCPEGCLAPDEVPY